MVKIVILNGVGSAGKGSIAKALQGIADDVFLHVQMDSFLEMLPDRVWGRPEGMVFERLEEDGHPSIAIACGPLVDRALSGMRRSVAALAAAGNNLIVDDVMLEDEPADYAALLRDFKVFTVGVHASLEVLEARERQRGDREIGLARWQFPRVHRGRRYDLDVTTDQATPLACAERIKAAFGL